VPIPTPEYVVIGGKRIVCDSYVADDAQTYYVPTDKLAFGTNAGTAVDTASPLPVTDGGLPQLHTDLVALLTELLQKVEPADLTTLHTDLVALLTELQQKVEPADVINVEQNGTFGYATGVAAGNVDVPTGARIKRVTVLPGAGNATVTILGGASITVPQGIPFDENVPGKAIATAGGTDVVIGGTVAAYYVAWVV
jgi:hypothetical protein